ncbi:MAG: HAD family hydrolase [Gemmatimonadaceae bacterium]
MRRRALAEADRMAAAGMRVLAFATRAVDVLPENLGELEHRMRFLGLVGLLDPPRPEAPAAVRARQEAGIRVVMLTGDHPSTALAILHGNSASPEPSRLPLPARCWRVCRRRTWNARWQRLACSPAWYLRTRSAS